MFCLYYFKKQFSRYLLHFLSNHTTITAVNRLIDYKDYLHFAAFNLHFSDYSKLIWKDTTSSSKAKKL